MREIIVPIDFSEGSVNALEHALTIAKRADLDILMVWVKKPEGTRVPAPEGTINHVVPAEEELRKLVEKYQPELPNTTITYKVREGKVYKEVCDEAEACSAFLIVTGTHGVSGFEEFWIGSNAQKIVSDAPCPVITIRGGVSVQRELTRIVMPIDHTLETRQKVPFTSLLAKLFDAEVHILVLYTTKVQAIRIQVEEYMEQVARYLHEHKVRFHAESIEVEDLLDDVLNYAKDVDANLISIMSEMVKSTKNIWLGSYPHQMVYHSSIPILVIHPKELLRMATGG